MEKVDLTEFWKNPKKSLIILYYKDKELARSEVIEHKFSEDIQELQESCVIEDIVTFELKESLIANNIKLLYEGELIAYRRIPDIHFEASDLLTITFTLIIEVVKHQSAIKIGI